MVSVDFNNDYQRYDSRHILDLYIGFNDDKRPSLMLVTPQAISGSVATKLSSSAFINVRLGRRQMDGRYALEFILTDDAYKELFDKFCEDLAESSRSVSSEEDGPSFLAERYSLWRTMFRNSNKGRLSELEIKGLIGELVFLSRYMFEEYGVDEALSAWCGPDGVDQDFRIGDYWYEVKAVNAGKETVHISSVEQLDTVSDGELVAVRVEQTSNSDFNGVTLNGLVASIRGQLSGNVASFDQCLLKHNYVSLSEYDNMYFRIYGYERYAITKVAPVLRSGNITAAATHVQYDLALSMLERLS